MGGGGGGAGMHPFGYNPILHVYHNEGGGVIAFCMGKMTAHKLSCLWCVAETDQPSESSSGHPRTLKKHSNIR